MLARPGFLIWKRVHQLQCNGFRTLFFLAKLSPSLVLVCFEVPCKAAVRSCLAYWCMIDYKHNNEDGVDKRGKQLADSAMMFILHSVQVLCVRYVLLVLQRPSGSVGHVHAA